MFEGLDKTKYTRLWVLCGLLALLWGCPDNNDNNKPTPKKDMASDMVKDIAADSSPTDMPSDMKDMSKDMVKDMGPSRCPGTPACAQGYAFDDLCVCRAPLDRKCQEDSDCRANETCTTFERVKVCMFDESTLKIRKCPGSEGCMDQGDGKFYAAGVSRIITPDGFEVANPSGIGDNNLMTFDPKNFGDNWRDCGYDNICPGEEGYPGPDEGEGDGQLQGIWIAGFNHGRPAQLCPEEKIGCDGPECCVSKWAHDDLKVQIAVVRRNDITVAFVAIDAVGFFRTEMEIIRKAIPKETDVDLVVMASSHSHEGPDTVGQWGPGTATPVKSGVDNRFLSKLRTQTIEGIKEAIDKLEEADVNVAVVDAGVDGLGISDSRPPYIFDDNLPIVQLTSKSSGNTLATLVSIGNHAEVLWSRNPYISADFFHFARTYVEQGLKAVKDDQGNEVKPALDGLGGVTVLFAGAVGGLINPGRGLAKDYAGKEYSEKGFAMADAVGQSLAKRVLKAVHDKQVTKLEQTDIRFATMPFLVPINNVLYKAAGWRLKVFKREIYNATPAGLIRFIPEDPKVMSEVAVVRIGPLTFFTAPGEVFPETLVGGFPGKGSTQNPVIGDVEGRRADPVCDDQGLPTVDNSGTKPCIVKADQENPPDWSKAPDGPYVYDWLPGQYPFFIGLGQDFLGYMVPEYDFQYNNGQDVPGNHYEETNSASGQLLPLWKSALEKTIDAVK